MLTFLLLQLAGTVPAPRPVSLDVSVGVSAGSESSPRYHDASGATVEITLVNRDAPSAAFGRVVGLTVGGTAFLNGSDVCILVPGSTTSCARAFPSIAHVALMAGGELARPHGVLRATAGPALFAGSGAPGAGVRLQLDASGGFEHLQLLGAASESLVFRTPRERLQLRSIRVGLRVL